MTPATIDPVAERRADPELMAIVWIDDRVIRTKHPSADLKLSYRRTFQASCLLTFILHIALAVWFPELEAQQIRGRRVQTVIDVADIPETRQMVRPPPPARPAVPIETESDDVPDDITIESTDLDFDDVNLNLPPPPPPGRFDEEAMGEEVVEFWAVEESPVLVKEVLPIYPDVASRAGLEGTVFVEFVVGRDGTVRDVIVLKGPVIFYQPAVTAVAQFRFKPAIQNDRAVAVRMARAIRFRLKARR